MSSFCFGGVAFHSKTANFALFVVRVFLGLAMLYIGIGKIPPSGEFVALVAKMGLPAPYTFAVLAGLFEIIGGALLVLGLFSRFGALMVMIIVGTAIVFVHAGDSFKMQFLPLLVFFNGLQFLLIGGGAWSIDAYFRGKQKHML